MSPRLTHRDASPCKGFTLTELLVAVAIILMLMSLIGAAVSNVRASQKVTATRDSIRKLNDIVMRQFRTYDNRSVDPNVLASSLNPNPPPSVFKYAAEQRAWHLRRNVLSAELLDRWTDASAMAAMWASKKWSATPIQKTFISIWSAATTKPSDAFAGAECLFMIVMQSGMTDPIEIRNLPPIGDKDSDGFMEFWDAWSNPIGYILWPYAVQLPGGSGQRFFSGARTPLSVLLEDVNGNGVLDTGETDYNGNGIADVTSATLGMRPLIYSAGPDGQLDSDGAGFFFRNSEAGNLASNAACGDWRVTPTLTSASSTDTRAADNITNFDDEAKP